MQDCGSCRSPHRLLFPSAQQPEQHKARQRENVAHPQQPHIPPERVEIIASASRGSPRRAHDTLSGRVCVVRMRSRSPHRASPPGYPPRISHSIIAMMPFVLFSSEATALAGCLRYAKTGGCAMWTKPRSVPSRSHRSQSSALNACGVNPPAAFSTSVRIAAPLGQSVTRDEAR